MQELERSDALAPPPEDPHWQCTVERAARRVVVNGREARLGGRAFDLLLVLLRHPGQVVPKQVLHDAVWPGLAVTPNNLDVQVWALRRCLGADAIRTVPRRGYALTPPAPIRLQDATDPAAAPEPAMDDPDGQVARVLLPRLHGGGQLALVGGDAAARARLCAALCALHVRTAPGLVWRLQPGRADMTLSARPALRRLERVGGLLVLAEGDVVQRAQLVAWVRGTHSAGRLYLLVTAPHPAPGIDADFHRLGATVADPLPVTPAPPRRMLRWQSRTPAGST